MSRKYIAEGTLNLFTGSPGVFRPSDMYIGNELAKGLEGTNIYLICARSKITIDPFSLTFDDSYVRGRLRAYSKERNECEPFRFELKLSDVSHPHFSNDVLSVSTKDEHGKELLIKYMDGRTTTMASSILVCSSSHKIDEDYTKLEVLYVGKAFGQTGQRVAADRLKRHTTLQKILSEFHDNRPNEDIILLAYQYGNYRFLLSSSGVSSPEPSTTDEEGIKYIDNVNSMRISRDKRILIAEAALINYFRPKYNEQHSSSFYPGNMKKLKTVKSIIDADLSGLCVEITTHDINAKLWTPHRLKSEMDKILNDQNGRYSIQSSDNADVQEFLKINSHTHIANFSLYSEEERESFLSGLPWSH